MIVTLVSSFLFVFGVFAISESIEDVWSSIEPPKKSYYAGFEAPTDLAKWKQAIIDSREGTPILLRKVFEQVRYPGEIISGDIQFGWIQRLSDAFVTKIHEFNGVPEEPDIGHRVPITLIGKTTFDRPEHEGYPQKFETLGADTILRAIKNNGFKLPKRIVGIGHMNENWGWLSSHITNRTICWGWGYAEDFRKPGVGYADEQIKPFLDDPNLVMLLVNQHHNVTHPKVISLPRGVLLKSAKTIWNEGHRFITKDSRKNSLMFSGASNYRHRPNITSCVKENMGDLMVAHQAQTANQNIRPEEFTQQLMKARAVLALPGLGYDCFRIWESLLCGSVPVMEKRTGLDRSLYRLPALLLDDFADLTPALLRQAYVEAVYLADQWDYTRLTERHWQRLVYETSISGNIDYMLKLHPLEAEDQTFTRPLIHFDCGKLGGCGPGTKRVPKKSCAIDPTIPADKIDWLWYENWEESVRKQKENDKILKLHAAKPLITPSIDKTTTTTVKPLTSGDDDTSRGSESETKTLMDILTGGTGTEKAKRIEHRRQRAKQRREEQLGLGNVDIIEEINDAPGKSFSGDETTATSTKKKGPGKKVKIRANKPRLRRGAEVLGA